MGLDMSRCQSEAHSSDLDEGPPLIEISSTAFKVVLTLEEQVKYRFSSAVG
jgi:hypothetical protein